MISDAQREMMSRVLGRTSAAMLKRGARGVTVRALQLYLRDQGQDIKADGTFGPETEKALKAFQAKAGVAADGRAGSKTLKVVRDGIKTPVPKPRPPATAVPGGVPPTDDAATPLPEMPSQIAMPGGAPPMDDAMPPSGGFDRQQYNKDLAAALIGASPDIRSHYGLPPELQVGTPGVQMPGGDFSTQFDPNMQGSSGMLQELPPSARGIGSDFAQMPQQDYPVMPPASYPTGNSPISPELGTGQMPQQMAQAQPPSYPTGNSPISPELDQQAQYAEWLKMLFANRPVVPPAPPQRPASIPSGIDL